VEFYINYEFRSFALGLLMGSVFDRAFRKFTEAFEERADEIYGAPSKTQVGARTA
jgi:coenzyme Q-binding protein COQ10